MWKLFMTWDDSKISELILKKKEIIRIKFYKHVVKIYSYEYSVHNKWFNAKFEKSE